MIVTIKEKAASVTNVISKKCAKIDKKFLNNDTSSLVSKNYLTSK